MSVETHLDELINYSTSIITALSNSQEIVDLLIDKKNADLFGEDGDAARAHMFDYDYVDDTLLSAGSYIMVEADVVSSASEIKELEIYVQVVVSKTLMELDHKKFKGVMGNRRDNLCRQIDLLLNGSREFGIGQLQLTSARIANVPPSFTSRMLTYKIYNFAKNKKVSR